MSTVTQQPPIDAGLSLAERARIIEALVFASAEPVAFKKLSPYLNEETELSEIIDLIKSRYDERSGIEFKVIDQTLAFRTKADVAAHLSLERPVQKPLSRAALEVLAIIAYHQPITRSGMRKYAVSACRAVQSIYYWSWNGYAAGTPAHPGRPLTWGQAQPFLTISAFHLFLNCRVWKT